MNFNGPGLPGGVSLRNDGCSAVVPDYGLCHHARRPREYAGRYRTEFRRRRLGTLNGTGFRRTQAGRRTLRTAAPSWVFGTAPGLYRVFATWPASAANSTKTPTASSTARPCAPRPLPTGTASDWWSRGGGHDFQRSPAWSSSLRHTEGAVDEPGADRNRCANVIADAIRIEPPGRHPELTPLFRAGSVTLRPAARPIRSISHTRTDSMCPVHL